jgi:hypothetical protein
MSALDQIEIIEYLTLDPKTFYARKSYVMKVSMLIFRCELSLSNSSQFLTVFRRVVYGKKPENV